MAGPAGPILDGLVFPEGLRWHAGRLWLSDIHSHRVLALAEDGAVSTLAVLDDAPSGLGFLPDGTPLVAMMRSGTLISLHPGGPAVHADLGAAPGDALNDMVVGPTGRAYVGCRVDPNRFPPAGAPPPVECVAAVEPDGSWAVAASPLVAPNGMTLSPDGATLVVAETRAHRLSAFDVGPGGELGRRRSFADLPDDLWPDGICMDEEGQVWAATGFSGAVVRVADGGTITDRVDLGDRWALACVLGGEDRRTLYCATAVTTLDNLSRLHGPEDDASSTSRGTLFAARVGVPGAGTP